MAPLSRCAPARALDSLLRLSDLRCNPPCASEMMCRLEFRQKDRDADNSRRAFAVLLTRQRDRDQLGLHGKEIGGDHRGQVSLGTFLFLSGANCPYLSRECTPTQLDGPGISNSIQPTLDYWLCCVILQRISHYASHMSCGCPWHFYCKGC